MTKLTGPLFVSVGDGAPMLTVGAVVSTVTLALGPLATALLPAASWAVFAARLMSSVPFPLRLVSVTVRVVGSLPLTLTVPVAVPVAFSVTSAAASVIVLAPV